MRGVIDRLGEFLRLESAASVLLIGAAGLALLFANSPLAAAYTSLLQVPIAVQVGDFVIHKPLLLWVNDGLMALFFFLVGLELKREFLDGELSRPEQLVLPFAGALGGMAAPALVYLAFNHADPVAVRGWAIPAATDIAFALGVLALLGNRVPLSLKLLLMSIAIFDDLGAIVIIALFYSADLAPSALAVAGLALAGLVTLNRRGVRDTAPYLLLGLVMWAAVLKSGVHATLAGVLLALTIPAAADGEGRSPLRDLEHGLHPSVAFGVLPLFAFANAGVMLTGLGVEAFTAPVPAGIALGLLFGKPLGVFGLMAAAVALRLAPRPADAGWGGLLGVACLCGVGFTMSLFIGSLAFEQGGPDPFVADRLGILAGSLGAALLGLAVLHLALPRRAA